MVWPAPSWFSALPQGPAYELNHPMAEETTIKVGGPAQVWASCENWAQVGALLAFANAEKIPLTWVGKGSNMVVYDGGIQGLVVPLGKGLDAVRIEGQTLYAEAGAATGTAARAAREAGLAGLAFFGGIPGSIGGALRMNAGAYGSETFDALTEVILLNETGEEVREAASFVEPRYRGTTLPKGWMYKAGVWKLSPGDKEEIRQQMREINQKRSTSQPLALPSSGSWFKNVRVTDKNLGVLKPIDATARIGGVVNAWRVVDAAGCRGWREGDAQVSEQHCNFFVNTGRASATELEALSVRVEAEITAKLGVIIEREVRFIGTPLPTRGA